MQRPLKVIALAKPRSVFADKDVPPLIYPFRLQKVVEAHPQYKILIESRSGDFSVKLEGIPEEALPKIHRDGDSVHVIFPDPIYVDLYRAEMGKILLELRARLSTNPKFGEYEQRLFARYFQLGLFAHIFPIGNTSLYQAQLFYLLKISGAKIPTHLTLADHVGYLVDSKTYENFFVELLNS